MLVPLVDGEEPLPVQRVVVLADSTNGLSGALDLSTWWFINTELTVHLHRPPVNEWVALDALSTYQPSGAGLAEGVLYDAGGRIGRSAQSLLVGRRA